MNEDAAAALRMTLCRIPQTSSLLEQCPALTEQLRCNLLLHGSSTDDNLACVEQLDVGVVREDWGTTAVGIRIGSLNRLVSNVLWHAEGCPVPDRLREAIPKITQEQWDVCLRLVTLLLTTFEAKVALSGDTPPAADGS